jgi:hypothetical protein
VERKGWEIFHFFRRAGLKSADPDDSPDADWTRDRLREFNGKDRHMEKIILRLANPTVYHGSLDETFRVISSLNRILEPERVLVELGEDRKPRLVDRGSGLPVGKSSAWVPLTIRQKPAPQKSHYLLNLLDQRLDEARRCVHAGAFVAALTLLGNLLEEFLVALAESETEHWTDRPNAPKNSVGDPKPIGEWSLKDLILTAREKGFIHVDPARLDPLLLDYRSLFHPGVRPGALGTPDINICMTSLEAVQTILQDLSSWFHREDS